MSEHKEMTSEELIAWGKEKGGVSEEMCPWEESCPECDPRYRLGLLAQRLEEAREAMRRVVEDEVCTCQYGERCEIVLLRKELDT